MTEPTMEDVENAGALWAELTLCQRRGIIIQAQAKTPTRRVWKDFTIAKLSETNLDDMPFQAMYPVMDILDNMFPRPSDAKN